MLCIPAWWRSRVTLQNPICFLSPAHPPRKFSLWRFFKIRYMKAEITISDFTSVCPFICPSHFIVLSCLEALSTWYWLRQGWALNFKIIPINAVLGEAKPNYVLIFIATAWTYLKRRYISLKYFSLFSKKTDYSSFQNYGGSSVELI